MLEVWGEGAEAQDGGILGHQDTRRLRKAADSEGGGLGREAFQHPGGVAHGGLSMNLTMLLLEINVPQTSGNVIQSL